MSDRVCSACGSESWTWFFNGWDSIRIDEEGAYQRNYKGDYSDESILCQVCEKAYDEDEDLPKSDQMQLEGVPPCSSQ